MSKIYNTAPIIICGMQRSGTTLMGELFRQNGIEVFAECALDTFVPFVQSVHRETTQKSWRLINLDTLDDRMTRLVYEIWRSVTPEHQLNSQATRFGIKTPCAELHYKGLDEVFSRRKPFYVYCVRQPEDVYRSLLRTKWGHMENPKWTIKRYMSSLNAALQMKDRIAIMDVDLATRELDFRQDWATRVFNHLGLELSVNARRFLRTWPPVNRLTKNDSSLDENKTKKRIFAFEKQAYRSGLMDLYNTVLQSERPF